MIRFWCLISLKHVTVKDADKHTNQHYTSLPPLVQWNKSWIKMRSQPVVSSSSHHYYSLPQGEEGLHSPLLIKALSTTVLFSGRSITTLNQQGQHKADNNRGKWKKLFSVLTANIFLIGCFWLKFSLTAINNVYFYTDTNAPQHILSDHFNWKRCIWSQVWLQECRATFISQWGITCESKYFKYFYDLQYKLDKLHFF